MIEYSYILKVDTTQLLLDWMWGCERWTGIRLAKVCGPGTGRLELPLQFSIAQIYTFGFWRAFVHC